MVVVISFLHAVKLADNSPCPSFTSLMDFSLASTLSASDVRVEECASAPTKDESSLFSFFFFPFFISPPLANFGGSSSEEDEDEEDEEDEDETALFADSQRLATSNAFSHVRSAVLWRLY